MSTLLYGMHKGVIPVEEQTVRSTTEVISVDTPAAEAKDAPEYNERETDPNPSLTGLSSRQVASDWHEREKYSANWAPRANVTDSFAYTSRRQAQLGNAAQKELTDQQGHGTISFAVGIEPTIRDGAAFGADYFAIDDRLIQDGIPHQLAPVIDDQDANAHVATAAKSAARDANASSIYSTWYNNATGR